jgi:hypothetical protein
MTQFGRDQLADADHGQHRQQQDEQNQKQRVASLNGTECGHGDPVLELRFLLGGKALNSAGIPAYRRAGKKLEALAY